MIELGRQGITELRAAQEQVLAKRA